MNVATGGVLCASKAPELLSSETSKSNLKTFLHAYSKPALTEGLEIDQYMWAILNTLNSSNTPNGMDTEEVVIDSQANWRAIKPAGNSTITPGGSTPGADGSGNGRGSSTPGLIGIKPDPDGDSKQFSKVMSPGSTSLPTWDNMNAMSPYMSPDMSSIASGSMMGSK